MKNRAKSGGSANGMVNKRPSVEQNVNAPPPSENSPQYKPHESQIFEALPFESYLAPRLSLEVCDYFGVLVILCMYFYFV